MAEMLATRCFSGPALVSLVRWQVRPAVPLLDDGGLHTWVGKQLLLGMGHDEASHDDTRRTTKGYAKQLESGDNYHLQVIHQVSPNLQGM